MNDVNSLADEILRNWRTATPKSAPLPVTNPALPSRIVPTEFPSEQVVLLIPLSQIRIDPQQRRKYLPADLRVAVIHSKHSVQDAMTELLARAGQGGPEAQGYVESVRALANSINRVGLQQPIRVAPEITNNDETVYRIVQGERRFWAHVLLERPAIPVVLETDEHSADETEQAQWAENLEREEVPAVDFADAVWDIRHRHLARLTVDKQYLSKSLGETIDKLSPDEAIARLTVQEVAHLTGRALAPSTLYRYLYIAEHLTVAAKNIARAHRINVSRLHQIAHLPADKQMNAVHRAAGLPAPADQPAIVNNGRPTTLHRCTTLCINLSGALKHLADKHIDRSSAEDKRALLEELDAAASVIEQVRQRLSRPVV